jgi:Uma2 family endonuclease
MNLARKFNPVYTVEDYRHWDGDWELIEGVAIAMTPSPTGEHQQMGMSLANAFYSQIQGDDCRHCRVYYELDWIIDEHTVVRPDLMVVCGDPVTGFLEAAPTLAAEILSPASQVKDRTVKRDLYQAQHVPYYLIADPQTRQLEVLQLREGGYQPQPSQDGVWRLELHSDCWIVLQSMNPLPG